MRLQGRRVFRMSAIDTLITGARGQLGLELQVAAPTERRLLAVDLPELDITDAAATEALIARLRPRWIINCAAYTAVDKAESDAAAAKRVNTDGARHIAQSAHRHGARLLQISTDFVFDGRKSSPYRPDDIAHPLSVYGQSKLEGEWAVKASTHGDALIVRTAWLYSVHGSNFVKTILRLMRERSELRVVADQVGTPTAAKSLASAIWKMIDSSASGGIYHFTDSGVASWYDFACAIREFAQQQQEQIPCEIIPVRTDEYLTAAQRPAYSVLDKTDTFGALGECASHWRAPLDQVVQQLLSSQSLTRS